MCVATTVPQVPYLLTSMTAAAYISSHLISSHPFHSLRKVKLAEIIMPWTYVCLAVVCGILGTTEGEGG